MAELNTAEETAKVDAAFLGITSTPPAAVEKVVETPKVEPAPVPAAAVPPVKAPEKPEYIRVTRQDWDKHSAMFGKVSSLESQIAKLTGSMPKADQLTQQIIDKVRAETPIGQVVEFSKEDVAEIAEDFPELAEKLLKALNKGKVKGTAPAEPAKAPPAGAVETVSVDKAVEDAFARRDAKQKADALEKEKADLLEAYPDWGMIVGAPIATGTKDPVDTDWRKWATTNDPSALVTDSHAEVKASIDKFKASQATPATPPKPDTAAVKRALIADAVTPRADGAPPPLNQPTSADDAFTEGFKKVRRH